MITKDSKNILVADDSLYFRTKLSEILVEAGHSVRLTVDGMEVIDEFKKGVEGIDLLILDLEMPNVDGFGVLEWITDNGFTGKFPILVVTGAYEPSHVMEWAKTLGANSLMTKACPPENILYRVNHLLFQRKSKSNRLCTRVPVSIPVDFTVDDVKQTGFLLNLSEDGAFLHTDVTSPLGASISLRFSLPEIEKTFEIVATVQWYTTYEKTSSGFFCGYGLSFGVLSEEYLKIFRGFIDAEFRRLGIEGV